MVIVCQHRTIVLTRRLTRPLQKIAPLPPGITRACSTYTVPKSSRICRRRRGLREVVRRMSINVPGRRTGERGDLSLHSDLNRGPSRYEGDALPLSYEGGVTDGT